MKKIFAAVTAVTLTAITNPAFAESYPACDEKVAAWVLTIAEQGDLKVAKTLLATCTMRVQLDALHAKQTISDQMVELDVGPLGYTWIQVVNIGDGAWALVGLEEVL